MKTYVYVGQSRIGDAAKIGITSDPDTRAADLKLDLLITIEFKTREAARDVELFLQRLCTRYRIDGEWFEPNSMLAEVMLAWMYDRSRVRVGMSDDQLLRLQAGEWVNA